MNCGSCKQVLNSGENHLKCGLCDSFFHIRCEGVSVTNYNALNKIKNLHWFCNGCNHDGIMKELKDLKNLKLQLTELDKKVEILTSKVNTSSGNGDQRNLLKREDVVEIIREEREIEKRKNNLCIFNLPESQDDKRAIQEICTQQLGLQSSDFSITETIRVGQSHGARPKSLIVKLSSWDDRSKILRNAPKLRNFVPHGSTLKVFISPDYTKKQREFQKDLRERLKARRENGEQVKIRGNEIVQIGSRNPQ